MQCVQKYSWKKMLSVSIFLSCCLGVFSQDYDYINYTTKDGLPTNYVYGVVEDDDGYIWAYTENGLAKFDGYTFQNFNTSDGLPGNDIVNAVKDKEGKIFFWIYNNRPSYLFQDSFHIIHDTPCSIINGLYDGYIDYVCEDYSLISFVDNHVVPVQYGLIDSFLLMKERNSFELKKREALPRNYKQGIPLDQSYNLIISQDSVFYYSFGKKSTIRSFTDGYIAIFYNSQKAYWKNGNQKGEINLSGFSWSMGSQAQQGLFELNNSYKVLVKNAQFEFLLLNFKNKDVKKIDLNQQGIFPESHAEISAFDSTFIISTDKGILEYDFEGNLVEKLILPDLVHNFYLHRGYKDSKGNFWVGSREGGLFFFPKQKRNTSRLTSIFSKDKTFERLISTSDGQLLGITDNCGIYHIKENQLIKVAEPIKRNRFRTAINTPHGIIISSSFRDFLIQNNGNQFKISSVKDKLRFQISSKAKTDKEDRVNGRNLFLNNAFSFSYDEKRQILYSNYTQGWVAEYRFIDGKKIEFKWNRLGCNNLYFHSEQDKLFSGYSEGMAIVKDEKMIPFLAEKNALKNISTIAGTGDDLWIGTESNGLFHYSFATQKLNKISDAANIRRLKFDQQNVYVSSNEGVLIVSKKAPSEVPIIQYTSKNGLPSNEIQDVHPTEDGKFIYVATTEGLYKIDRIADFKTTLSAENLQINKVSVNQKIVSKTDHLNLSHLENNLEIQYHLQSYASNGDIKYFTKLEPIQKDWKETKEREINFFSLAPNEYTFNLKAQDIYGNEVSIEPLKMKIRKAFWQTIGFRLMTAFAFLGGLIFWFLRRERKQKEQLQKEKTINRRMAELELSALRAQMNPHFVFNALGAIQYYIQTNEVEAADDYLTKFARLMRKYLDSSKQKMISLKNEIELLEIYTDLEKLRFEDLFAVKIEVQKDIDVDDIYLPSMLIQPFVENAINHGLDERRDKKGILNIRFYKEHKVLVCEINDNGVGRKNTQATHRKGHHSRGLGIIQEKIQTLRASGLIDISLDIQDLDSTDPKYPGTQVILKIKHLDNDNI